jgi:hypothetical protein
LTIIGSRLSRERITPYETLSGGPAGGLTLYEWNTTASAAFYGTLQALEVVLRNALHEQMSVWHTHCGLPGSWLDDPANLLEQRRHDDIDQARRRVWQGGYQLTPPQIITELPFGFWRYLLSSRYHNVLWVPALRHAFKQMRPQRRREIYEPLERLNRLRNRIAHHEPIHRRNLARDQADALKVLAAICPVTTAWVDQISLVPAVLAGRPPVPRQRRV